MQKSTWSNYKRSGIWVDPPPLFFQNSHIFPFFWGGSVPNEWRWWQFLIKRRYSPVKKVPVYTSEIATHCLHFPFRNNLMRAIAHLHLFNFALLQGYPPGMDGHGVGQAKTKRARTSFKHHQLRIMKAHFQVNQNPDSRELKMLSQKTGLDKKVLQVRVECLQNVKSCLLGS